MSIFSLQDTTEPKKAMKSLSCLSSGRNVPITSLSQRPFEALAASGAAATFGHWMPRLVEFGGRHRVRTVTSEGHSHGHPEVIFCFSAAHVTPRISCVLSDLLTRRSQELSLGQLLKFLCSELQGKLEPLQQHAGDRKAQTL